MNERDFRAYKEVDEKSSILVLESTARIRHLDQLSSTDASFYDKIVDDYLLSLDIKKHAMLSQTVHLQYLRDSMKSVFGRRAILFSLDLEAWEQNNNTVTEIGISIYDPRDQASSLFPSITQIHIRIKEYLNNRNGRFVPDHAVNSNSGFSYSMKQREAVAFVQMLVNYYFKTSLFPVFLVGHNVKGDLLWLNLLGVDMGGYPLTIDTQRLFAISNGLNGSSLKKGLRTVEIPHAYLHNGGNDSYYTLLLAMKLCDPMSRKYFKLDESYGPRSNGPSISGKERKYRELRAPNNADTVEQTAQELILRLYDY